MPKRFKSRTDTFYNTYIFQLSNWSVISKKYFTYLQGNGFRDMTEPCGGMTSNPNIAGNSNRGCTKTKEYNYAQMPSKPQTTSTKPWYFRTDTTKTKPPTTTTTPSWYKYTTTTPFRNWGRPTRRTTTTRRPTTTTTVSTTTQPEYYYNGDEYYYSYESQGNSDEYYYYENTEYGTTESNEQDANPNNGISR